MTQSSYTGDEDFVLADAVFDSIGDVGDERFSLHDLTTPGAIATCFYIMYPTRRWHHEWVAAQSCPVLEVLPAGKAVLPLYGLRS